MYLALTRVRQLHETLRSMYGILTANGRAWSTDGWGGCRFCRTSQRLPFLCVTLWHAHLEQSEDVEHVTEDVKASICFYCKIPNPIAARICIQFEEHVEDQL